ncbi:MAG: hypothetical protein WBY93_02820 [Candidatus Binatus sp.]
MDRLGRENAAIFEADRSALARELHILRRQIEECAIEMKMVAAEGVFDQSLSRALLRRAEKLRLVARDLTNLLSLVERARVPGGAKRPKPAPPLQRRKPK